MKEKFLISVLLLGLVGLFFIGTTTWANISTTPTELSNEDSDKDGHIDLCEFLHKSDPKDKESIPQDNITINVPKDVESIQSAINASIDGDTIVVSQGRYQGNINFNGRTITLTSTDPLNPDVVAKTIIEGTEPGSVIIIDSNSVLKGFTITSPDLDCRGIYCKSASPTIENCTIIDNRTTETGGGIYISTTISKPKIINCIITKNKDSSGTSASAQISGGTPQISQSWVNGHGLTDTIPPTETTVIEPTSIPTEPPPTTEPETTVIEPTTTEEPNAPTTTPPTETPTTPFETSTTTTPLLEVIEPDSPVVGEVTVTVAGNDLDNFYLVYLWCDNSIIGVSWPTSLQFNWNTTRFTNGTHTLKAKAYHYHQGWFESPPIEVTISNATPDVPSITINNPADGKTVSGNVTISASLSHPTQMTRLATYFYVNNEYLGPSFSSPAGRTWATEYFPDGAYTVKVVSYFCDPGLTFQIYCEDTVSVTVDNTTTLNPEVRIDNLADGQEVEGTVTIEASVTDPANMLAVICYINEIWLGYDSSSPYQFTWNTQGLEDGTYTIKVMSYHSVSGLWYEKEISVMVNNLPNPSIIWQKTGLSSPVDVVVDNNRNVYVLESGASRVTIYDKDGNYLAPVVLGASNPMGIALDNDGNLYIADTGYNRIIKMELIDPELFVFSLDTTFSGDGIAGEYGTGDTQLNQPWGIGVDSDGNVYVSDSGNNRIQKLDSTGEFVDRWGTSGTEDGQLNQPKGLFVDVVDNIHVVDSGNNRIQEFSSGGSLWNVWQSTTPFNQPADLALNNYYIYVTDAGNNRVQKFDSDNQYITALTNLNLNNPQGIAIDENLEQELIYIADTGNNRLIKVEIPISDPQKPWDEIKDALSQKDIELALTNFSDASKERYREIFTLLIDELPRIMSEMQDIYLISIEGDVAKYYIKRMEDGQEMAYYIYFVKEDGKWKVDVW